MSRAFLSSYADQKSLTSEEGSTSKSKLITCINLILYSQLYYESFVVSTGTLFIATPSLFAHYSKQSV